MVRDILFRGKRIDNGEWAFGAYYNQEFFYGVAERKPYIITSNECLQNDIALEYTEVIKETVSQYTSLTDKNGKSIFEGDVVIYDNSPYNAYCEPIRGVIAWRNGSLCFKYKPWSSVMYRALCSDDFFAAKCEIIGNIHDNPELLEDSYV